MTHPEIPEEAVRAAARQFYGLAYAAAGEGGKASMRGGVLEALAAALPHLRVQETRWVTIEDDDPTDGPWPSGLSPDNPFLTPQAEYVHVHSNGPDPADCTTCEPPAPRPVVDREAMVLAGIDAAYRSHYPDDPTASQVQWSEAARETVTGRKSRLRPGVESVVSAVLALLPTEEDTKAEGS